MRFHDEKEREEIPARFRDTINSGDVSMIRRVVDRCHVSDSRATVLRALVGALKPGAWPKASRQVRRAYTWAAIHCHAENRDLYGAVFSGRF